MGFFWCAEWFYFFTIYLFTYLFIYYCYSSTVVPVFPLCPPPPSPTPTPTVNPHTIDFSFYFIFFFFIVFFPLSFSLCIHSSSLQSAHCYPSSWVLFPLCSISSTHNLPLLAAILLSIYESIFCLLVEFVH